MATTHHACNRITARMARARPAPATPWIAPSLPELIAAIDAALNGRRRG